MLCYSRLIDNLYCVSSEHLDLLWCVPGKQKIIIFNVSGGKKVFVECCLFFNGWREKECHQHKLIYPTNVTGRT